MTFRRKIYNKLLEWKSESDGKSAVLIEGARRVGKSTIAEEFARNEYDDYILLDFALETRDTRRNFEDNIDSLFSLSSGCHNSALLIIERIFDLSCKCNYHML